MTSPLPYPYGAALGDALLKSVPQDFEVEEVLGFEPDGEGEHLFVWVEKTGLTTHELIERLAKQAQVSPASISHSGMKDKQAVTRQWLSLHLPGQERTLESEADAGYHILRQQRHSKKLRPGTHRANRFTLRLRELFVDAGSLDARMGELRSGGFANYFGDQRFGSRQDNVQRALIELDQRKLRRQRRGLLISSLRSYLFNRILARRIEQGIWLEPVAGDLFMLRGSHSVFSEAIDDSIRQRFQMFDISSCASLYGSGTTRLSEDALAIEQAEFEANAEITACLERQQSRLQMRPTRAVADELDYDYDAAKGVLELSVCLPAGCYVTVLLSHFAKLHEAGRGPASV